MKKLKSHWDAKKEAERLFKKADALRRKQGNCPEVSKIVARAEQCQKFFESQLTLFD
jgi:hypothetical protein